MDFYQQAGVLVLGSRLRRLSETFIGDINKLYKQQGIAFEAAWFPVFYVLGQEQALSITTIADTLATSHSAASQLITKLEEKGLLKVLTDKTDNRRKKVQFTARGQKLYQQVQPVWQALEKAMLQLFNESQLGDSLMPSLLEAENALAATSLLQRIQEQLPPKRKTDKK
ncbi:MAG: MarR family transcriptional regulator [Bacteroidetes bacterium]|nr:MarR family transcriptional regulator [Bacteroidota bacterium]